ncbi:MAG TPA: FAD-dependent oxidoreductase [Vicinamibacterales bacterium]|nr:FAD-dependent oxidoreductase [Vicinamibacterales bacterium]
MPAVDTLVLPISSVSSATPSTRLVRLALGGREFVFQAGQAALIGLAERDERVPYSIASAPAETARSGMLEFLVKVEPSGRWGHQFDTLERGGLIGIQGPFGSFVFPAAPRERHFLFIAGGTGIAPIRAMIRQALLSGQTGKMKLLYTARTGDDFAYLPELREMVQQNGLELRLHATRATPAANAGDTLRTERGRIGLAQIAPLLDDPATLCFVCGPESMLIEVQPMLVSLGIDPARVRIEEW